MSSDVDQKRTPERSDLDRHDWVLIDRLATFGFMLLGLLLLSSSVLVGFLAWSFTLEEAFGGGHSRDIGKAVIGGVVAVTFFVLAIVSLAQAVDTRAARSARAARAARRGHSSAAGPRIETK